jgi:hypothetical protein
MKQKKVGGESNRYGKVKTCINVLFGISEERRRG